VALALLAALALASAALSLRGRAAGEQARLAEARARWQAAPISHYRLAVEETRHRQRVGAGAAGARCIQELEVRDGQLVTFYKNSCGQAQLSVDDLFDLIAAKLDTVANPISCADIGSCMCRFAETARAEYAPAEGYPRRIIFRYEWATNWAHPDYWRYAWQRGALTRCNPTSISRTIAITLTPLP
jgi:hypothetical protein